jgi:hypothetical protein
VLFDKGLFRVGDVSSMTVGDLRTILRNIQQLCASAGAKTAAKDLQAFSDILRAYSDTQLTKACADIKHRLSAPGPKPPKPPKPPSGQPDPDIVQQHLTVLRGAGIDEAAFEVAFKKLKASKSVKLADLAEIARQFSRSVTAYKSKAVAYSDIQKVFIHRARFENKLL